MSIRHQETSTASIGQSPGCDPKSSKRSSGLFSFLKWFKTSTSRESVTHYSSSSSSSLTSSSSSSCDSLNSISSRGTVASFSFISPHDYKAKVAEKNIVPGPETDTYKARLKQRDKRRENDKNLTLRKKYNLFFQRDTLLKSTPKIVEENDNSKSLPLMTKKTMKSEDDEEDKLHRRTNSESSKTKKAGAYCHVKGKRKAPQPPAVNRLPVEGGGGTSTMSLRRKKRLAPQPPISVTTDKVIYSFERVNGEDIIEYADADVIFNDSLKLDHGVLKAVKENEKVVNSKTSNIVQQDQPVSPRPWYKRNLSNRESGNFSSFKFDEDDRYEPIEVSFVENGKDQCKISKNKDESKQNKKKDEKRKSGISFLTNISELDREASEIIRKENRGEADNFEPPLFMRPKDEPMKSNSDSWISPKRKSAKDLIAKFNAITNVTKVTVNSAFFGGKESGAFQKENVKHDYFGKSTSQEHLKQTKASATKCQNSKNSCELADKYLDDNKNKMPIPLMKSESAIIKTNNGKDTPKFDKKSWYCPKCFLENDYWRIICYVCSTIKPYFDDLTTPPTAKNNALENNKKQNSEIKHFQPSTNSDFTKNKTGSNFNGNPPPFERHLERSKTQIGFSALAKVNGDNTSKKFGKSSVNERPIPILDGVAQNKQEERERLKKMLIEMKNSLPKRKLSKTSEKNVNRASVIEENAENSETSSNPEEKIEPNLASVEILPKPPVIDDQDRVAEIVIETRETVYENIKVKKINETKPVKVSSSAQTSTKHRKLINPSEPTEKGSFELLRPKDFENMYGTKTEHFDRHVYTNLAEDRPTFLNVSMKLHEIKNRVSNNTDTLEVNRLLKRLETAIAKGELIEASNFARDLAQLKINCSVVRQKSLDGNERTAKSFKVNMYVEDKISHRGPFPIYVTEELSVAQLKKHVEKEFQIPVLVQRWILGKRLVSDDNLTMKDLNVTKEDCSIFLYLVASHGGETKPETKETLVEDNFTAQPVESKPSTSNNSDTNVNRVESNQDSSNYLKNIDQTIKLPTWFEIFTNNEPGQANETSVINLDVLKVEDEAEDYDTKTLKPNVSNNHWECIMCTFLNVPTDNVCAICATVRKLSRISPSKVISTAQKLTDLEPIKQEKEKHYKELLDLDNADLVENTENFECIICLMEIEPHDGVTLRDCLHQFCKPCLTHTIEFTDDAEIKCPFRDDEYSCDVLLQDREIKALLTPQMYEQFLAKSVAQAENKIDKSFHCKTPDCRGWCIFEDNVNYFQCPVCKKTNCLTCQAIHMGLNCKQFQESIQDNGDENTRKTKDMLEEMVNKGEAIKCPTCQVILMKKWGCDWLRCSMCKTEICWVTRGPRWGPAGKGDLSGGCQCGVNGIKCHPQCNYCH